MTLQRRFTCRDFELVQNGSNLMPHNNALQPAAFGGG